jgi:hypothetical protein
MKLEKWALLAEIVSGVAIVITLVILILEVRGNTDAVRVQTISAQRIAENERRDRVILNMGGIADLVRKGADSEQLSSTEGFRLNVYYIDTLLNFEWQFTEAQAGRLPLGRLDLQTWRAIWETEQIMRSVFENRRPSLDPAFVEFFERNVVDAVNVQ